MNMYGMACAMREDQYEWFKGQLEKMKRDATETGPATAFARGMEAGLELALQSLDDAVSM